MANLTAVRRALFDFDDNKLCSDRRVSDSLAKEKETVIYYNTIGLCILTSTYLRKLFIVVGIQDIIHL